MNQNTKNSRRLKILFTEGSSTSSREALYCLGPNHKIDILDPSPFCQSRFSRFVRRWYRCPSYSREPLAYLRFLVRLLRTEKYDVLFPTHEQIFLLARVKQQLQELVGLTVPDFDSLQRVYDKASFARLLAELNLPRPKTVIVNTADELEKWDAFPRYIKLAHGTAGQGVWHIENKLELRKLMDVLQSGDLLDGEHEILIQEPIVGIQEDAGGFFYEGKMLSGGSIQATIVGVGGAAMQRVGTDRPEMVEHVRKVGEKLNWTGPLGLAGISNAETGQLGYIEANPRIGETVPGLLAGVNLCEIVAQISIGQPPVEFPTDLRPVKTHQSFLNFVSLALAGRGRLAIFRDVVQASLGVGVYAGSEDELTRPRDDWLSLVPAAAVTMLVLAYPPAAQRLVSSTVKNYALPGSGANAIARMSQEELHECFH